MKTIYTLLIILIASFAQAQNNSGQIVFVETMKLEMKFEGADAERFKAMMPSERKSKFQLVFTDKSSLYQTYEGGAEDDEKEMSWSGQTAQGEAVVKMKFAQPDNKYFTDLQEKRIVNKREFMGKNFLILGEADEMKWKMSGEQKEVQGYMCQKAVLQDTARTVEAWFTPQIPISGGPAEYFNLPGMILELTMDEGKRVITADNIEFREVAKNEIAEPSGGKKVTSEEFKAIVDEKMAEMKEMGGGNRIMIIEH